MPAAWQALLHRPFHGLDRAVRAPFTDGIDDPYLRVRRLRSLALAGEEQQHLYDLSFRRTTAARRTAPATSAR